jgi:paraquat-inducible protein A
MTAQAVTGLKASIAGCHTCGLASRIGAGHDHHCPRCGSPLHLRKTNSLERTWALVIAAAIFYFPANLLPITHTSALGKVQSDTIMSGVLYFLKHGDWPLALVIFVASVAVPLLKLLILAYLLWTVQRRSTTGMMDRTRLYRLTEAVGRWSMVDVFVVTVLVALVRLGILANIEAGPGATYFSLVVVVTMIAAHSFDPKLIWDPIGEDNEPSNRNG